MSKQILITGNSSGIGAALTDHYARAGHSLFGLSRRGYQGAETVRDSKCDLSRLSLIPVTLDSLLGQVSHLDLVVLNASVLGPIGAMTETSIDDAQRVMDINLWSNKVILDWFIENGLSIDQIVLISSGASTKGNPGWNVYSVSKAALNMLTQLYAHELPDTHLSAIAPGIVDTAMQNTLCEDTDASVCPAVDYLRGARGTSDMPDAETAAPLLASAFDNVREQDSGGFHDYMTLL